jgi:hypothetical protein
MYSTKLFRKSQVNIVIFGKNDYVDQADGYIASELLPGREYKKPRKLLISGVPEFLLILINVC